MTNPDREPDDDATLRRLGYAPELSRRMGAFSNFALSFSIICILAGGVTSFHLGYCGVGGAAIGLGWPLGCLFALAVAMTMAQVASAFPTAGGLYHWAAILGGRGWGWATAWLNLAGLITATAAINVGAFAFAPGMARIDPRRTARGAASPIVQALGVAAIMGSQAVLNHLGVRLTSRLTDFSGYLILIVAAALTAAMLMYAPAIDPSRLVTFANHGGEAGGGVWPEAGVGRLFALGLLLPLYTMTGFDASAHAAEETLGAARNVPRGIVRSVLVSGVAGWIMLASVVVAIPVPAAVASRGDGAFPFALAAVLPRGLCSILGLGIAAAMYGCGLGALMSASRMAYAFARDGGLPFSAFLRRVGLDEGTGLGDLDGGRGLVALHALDSGLRDDHGSLRDLPVSLLCPADHTGRGRLRPGLAADGAVGPGAVVSAAGRRERARVRGPDRDRRAAAEREGRPRAGRGDRPAGGRLVPFRASSVRRAAGRAEGVGA